MVNVLLGCLFALVANFSIAGVPTGGSEVYLLVSVSLYSYDQFV